MSPCVYARTLRWPEGCTPGVKCVSVWPACLPTMCTSVCSTSQIALAAPLILSLVHILCLTYTAQPMHLFCSLGYCSLDTVCHAMALIHETCYQLAVRLPATGGSVWCTKWCAVVFATYGNLNYSNLNSSIAPPVLGHHNLVWADTNSLVPCWYQPGMHSRCVHAYSPW